MQSTFGLLLLLLAGAHAGLPIPNVMDGFSLGDADAPVQFELFGDTMCPDTAQAYPTIREVAASYGPEKLRLTFHAFSLAFIHSSMLTNQGLWVVASANASNVWNYIELIFANQNSLWNDQTADLTTNQVIAKVAALAANVSIIDENAFIKGMADQTIEMQAITSWKYIASRAIAGTPTFLVNGVAVDADPDWTVQDWQQILNPLFGGDNGGQEEQEDAEESGDICVPRLVPTFKPLSGNCTCTNGLLPCQVTPTKCQCCEPGEYCIPNEGCTC